MLSGFFGGMGVFVFPMLFLKKDFEMSRDISKSVFNNNIGKTIWLM